MPPEAGGGDPGWNNGDPGWNNGDPGWWGGDPGWWGGDPGWWGGDPNNWYHDHGYGPRDAGVDGPANSLTKRGGCNFGGEPPDAPWIGLWLVALLWRRR